MSWSSDYAKYAHAALGRDPVRHRYRDVIFDTYHWEDTDDTDDTDVTRVAWIAYSAALNLPNAQGMSIPVMQSINWPRIGLIA